jgi:DNA-binding transcriptional MocR family regulator
MIEANLPIRNWRARPGPMAERLAAALRDAIGAGDLAPGARLPPERTLAAALRVSRGTVVAAYDTLRSETWLESRRGSGTYVSAAAGAPSGPRRDAAVVRGPIGPSGPVVDLTVASPAADETVVPAVRAAAHDLERQTGGHGYFTAGVPALRAALAAHLARAGLTASEDEILVTTGSQQALALLAAELVAPGDTAIVESPTYAGALDALRSAGARLVSSPVGDEGVTAAAVGRLMARTQPRLVYVTPSFNNPTGAVIPARERGRLARLAGEFQVPLIEDHAVADLAYAEPPPPPLASVAPGAPVVTVGSLSKLFWGGLRVGWLRGPRHLVDRLARRKAVADTATAVVDQLAAVRLLAQADAVRARRTAELAARRDLLARLLGDLLPDWTWRTPAGGVCLWARLPAGDARDLAAIALRRGVAVVPGSHLAPDEAWAQHVRVPFTAEPAALETGVARLAGAWAEYRPVAGRRPAQPGAVV